MVIALGARFVVVDDQSEESISRQKKTRSPRKDHYQTDDFSGYLVALDSMEQKTLSIWMNGERVAPGP